ncbi:MAG TPA: 30S ribosomal protein S2 [Actinomycetota bacterium]|nr:30S ribosomal protein S2 [Actinomycetota bacterium]
MAVVTLKDLLEAGVHFGHQTRRWNPKMRRFIFTERNGIYIIDLLKTLGGIEAAYEYCRDLAARGGVVLFVGTKKQIADAVADEAKRVGMPFVNYRWVGGMLTNFQTMQRRILRMRELETQEAQGIFEEIPKKEALRLRNELGKLQKNLEGIRDLNRRPDAVFVVDTRKEDICVREARKLGMPIIAIVDTNCDPDDVDYIIPGNDDAIRSGALLTRVIADAIADGMNQRPPEVVAAAEAAAASGITLTAGGEEPPAEWEIMLAQQETETSKRTKEEFVPEAGPAAEPSPAAENKEASAQVSDGEQMEDHFQHLLADEPLPGEEIEEELKQKYKDEEEGKSR